MAELSHTVIAVVGIDIGKNSIYSVGLDQRGAIALRQKWSRGQIEACFASYAASGVSARFKLTFHLDHSGVTSPRRAKPKAGHRGLRRARASLVVEEVRCVGFSVR